jgi:hypothetical protein
MALRSAVLVVAIVALAAAAQGVAEYRVKAELLERFTRFVEWPSGAGRADFVIGVVGRNPFHTYLDELASSRRIKGKTVRIQQIRGAADVTSCDILFIAASERAALPAILGQVGARPILTVGDTEGFATSGVAINFYNVGETVRFEINEAALSRHGLRASSKLLKLARLVEER